VVAKESKRIAWALVNKSVAGDSTSTRLLADVTGIRRPRKPPVKKPRGFSQAALFASDPPWQGSLEASVQTDAPHLGPAA
jgi:hypothetical protein